MRRVIELDTTPVLGKSPRVVEEKFPQRKFLEGPRDANFGRKFGRNFGFLSLGRILALGRNFGPRTIFGFWP